MDGDGGPLPIRAASAEAGGMAARARRLAATAVVALAAGLAGCSAPTDGPTTPPGPTATASPSASPSPTATPSPTPSPTGATTSPTPVPPSTAPGVPAALAGQDVERIPTQDDVVALTFDCGASNAGVASILATLAAEGVPATFFATGDFARTYPGDLAAVAAAGHRLGNHSDTHAHYPQLTNAQIAADLARAEDAIVAAAGQSAAPLFRFPFGDRTPADVRAVNAAGYLPVRWTVDSLGWQGTDGVGSAGAVTQRVLAAAVPGAVVLMHVGANPDDGTTFDADALPAVIAGLRARGYAFVTLDALLP